MADAWLQYEAVAAGASQVAAESCVPTAGDDVADAWFQYEAVAAGASQVAAVPRAPTAGDEGLAAI